jgi:hypothetical protein
MEELAFLDCAINLISAEHSCLNVDHLYPILSAMQVFTKQRLLCPRVAAMQCNAQSHQHRSPTVSEAYQKKLQRMRYLRTRPRQKVKAELQSRG